jgi:hypothetical protein
MRKSKIIKIDDREITISELTVANINKLFVDVSAQAKPGAANIIDLLFGADIPVEAVAVSCGITVDELEAQYAPSEINVIVEAVKEVNPFFTAMLAKLTEAVAKGQAQPQT